MIVKRYLKNQHDRVIISATAGFGMNLAYALYHGISGMMTGFLWLLLLCAYYMILSVMRFSAILYDHRNVKKPPFSESQEIMMITIAAYTFYKAAMAIVNAIKARRQQSSWLTAIRNIGCADAAASLLTLQRSMLVSFGGMSNRDISLMNALTGAGVCTLIAGAGI